MRQAGLALFKAGPCLQLYNPFKTLFLIRNMKANNTALIALRDEFINAAIKHHEATESGEFLIANEQADIIWSCVKKFRMHGFSGNDELLSLINNKSLIVASMAAAYSLRYKPEPCLSTLKRISSEPGLLGFNARQCIKRWKSGEWALDQE